MPEREGLEGSVDLGYHQPADRAPWPIPLARRRS
jgi:hypothetical protein